MASIVDVVLSVLADISLWKMATQRVSPFVIERLTYQFTNLNFSKSASKVDVGKSGDLLYKTALLVSLPGMTSHFTVGTTAGVAWATAAQEAAASALGKSGDAATLRSLARPYYGDVEGLIERAEVRVNTHVFDRTSGLALQVEYEYSDGPARGLGRNHGERATITERQDASFHGLRALVYFRFWHCMASQNAYPLVCHGQVNFSVQCSFRPLAEIVQYPYGTAALGGGALNAATLTESLRSASGVELLTYQVYLHNSEREVFWNSCQDYVFTQMQMVVQDKTLASGISQHEEQLYMSGPIRAIYWALTTESVASSGRFSQVTGHSWGGDESFGSAQLLVNGSPYNDALGAECFRGGEAAAFGRACPDSRFYALHFCLNYDDHFQTSGSTAISRAETVKLKLTFGSTNASSSQTLAAAAYLQVFAQNWNVMRVCKGVVGIKINN